MKKLFWLMLIIVASAGCSEARRIIALGPQSDVDDALQASITCGLKDIRKIQLNDDRYALSIGNDYNAAALVCSLEWIRSNRSRLKPRTTTRY